MVHCLSVMSVNAKGHASWGISQLQAKLTFTRRTSNIASMSICNVACCSYVM
jgi:hypothetical protein